MDKGLYPSLEPKHIPVVAVPQAAERIFLVADLGKSRRELKRDYPYVDFDTAFPSFIGEDDVWHYVPTDEEKDNYVEWRPSGEGQVYACMGEPQGRFEERMESLLEWLDSRLERTIAVVCHAGVILWFLGEVIDNCHVRVVDFQDLKNPKRLYEAPQQQAAQLK
jgi:broad specificity phosphatase PhoE